MPTWPLTLVAVDGRRRAGNVVSPLPDHRRRRGQVGEALSAKRNVSFEEEEGLNPISEPSKSKARHRRGGRRAPSRRRRRWLPRVGLLSSLLRYLLPKRSPSQPRRRQATAKRRGSGGERENATTSLRNAPWECCLLERGRRKKKKAFVGGKKSRGMSKFEGGHTSTVYLDSRRAIRRITNRAAPGALPGEPSSAGGRRSSTSTRPQRSAGGRAAFPQKGDSPLKNVVKVHRLPMKWTSAHWLDLSEAAAACFWRTCSPSRGLCGERRRQITSLATLAAAKNFVDEKGSLASVFPVHKPHLLRQRAHLFPSSSSAGAASASAAALVNPRGGMGEER